MAAPAKLISTSIGFQDPKGTVVANGMLMLTLSQTATVVATGGQVTTEPIYLNLDANGKITSTAIWFNDELSPSGTIYYGVVYAANKIRQIPGLDKLQYSITGASFDLATAVQSGPASPSFSGAVMLTPTATQTITVGGLTLSAGGFTATAATSTFAGVSATSITNTGDTSLSSGKVIKWNNDTGLSRLGADIVAVGNGTAGDTSGAVTAAAFVSPTSPVALSGLLRGPNNSSLVSARNAGNSGDIVVMLLNGSNLVALGTGPFIIPAAADTAVGKTTTDTLINKTLNSATGGNSIVSLASLKQDATAQLTGNSGDQTVWTFSIPGGTIEAGKGIDFDIWISHDVGTATITWKLTYGSAVVSTAIGGTSVVELHFRATICNNNGVTNAQRLGMDAIATNSSNTGTATGAVDTTSAQTLTLSFNVANTDKITGHSLRVLKF